MEMRSPKAWLEDPRYAGVEIVDCDGWTQAEWETQAPITEVEFTRRLAACSITGRLADSPPTAEPALPGVLIPARAIEAAAATMCNRSRPCNLCQRDAARVLEAGLAAIDPSFLTPGHVLVVGGDRWTLQHPLTCRPNLADCPVHDDVSEAETEGFLPGPGSYQVTVEDGVLLLDGVPAIDLGDDDDQDDGNG